MFGWIARKFRSFLSAESTALTPQIQHPSLNMSFWVETSGSSLAQGDFLANCLVPAFAPSFGTVGGAEDLDVARENLIVVTQSRDLANAKVLTRQLSLAGRDRSFPLSCPVGLQKYDSCGVKVVLTLRVRNLRSNP